MCDFLSGPKIAETKFEPLPTKDSESVLKAKKDAQLAAQRRRGIQATVKNTGGEQGIGDPVDSRRTTLGGVKAA